MHFQKWFAINRKPEKQKQKSLLSYFASQRKCIDHRCNELFELNHLLVEKRF